MRYSDDSINRLPRGKEEYAVSLPLTEVALMRALHVPPRSESLVRLDFAPILPTYKGSAALFAFHIQRSSFGLHLQRTICSRNPNIRSPAISHFHTLLPSYGPSESCGLCSSHCSTSLQWDMTPSHFTLNHSSILKRFGTKDSP
jgi:hypothetical protein